jgi:hypothetical protein
VCDASLELETLDDANEPQPITLTCDRDPDHPGHHHDAERGDWATPPETSQPHGAAQALPNIPLEA